MKKRAATLFLTYLLSWSLSAETASSQSLGDSVLTQNERELVASVPYSNHPEFNRSGVFDVRFSMAAGTGWREIYRKPTIIRLSIAPTPGHPGQVESVGDVEGVFPIQPRYLFRVLTDYDAYPRITPRTTYSVERSTLTGMYAYHKRVMKVSAQFLGFGDSYLFTLNNYAQRLGPESYGVKWNLERSLDGKFTFLFGSWYVQAVNCGSEVCSYLRYFNHTGFKRPPPVPTPILHYFTAESFRNLLVDFFNAAVRLRHAETLAHAAG